MMFSRHSHKDVIAVGVKDPFPRISILTNPLEHRRTIHSEYDGKETGPETMLAANSLVRRAPLAQKCPLNQYVVVCLIFSQISKKPSNR